MHPPEDMVHQKKHTLEDFGKDRKDEQKNSVSSKRPLLVLTSDSLFFPHRLFS